MTSRVVMFAGYNAWANERLYEAAARLSDADYRADRGAFFKSMHGTLNHLLVADRIWMRRFTGEGDVAKSLDAILHEDFGELRAARRAEDERIIHYVHSLTDADLAGWFRYRTITNPVDMEQRLSHALDHFFNHQTHHRGQAHALLTAITGTAPSFDLIIFQRESGIGGSRKVE
ncbi:MAG: DinB family protein [Pseudorhodoplanes sp.]|nr:DinB family protein [Pseudorhodoplanes sp.]